jgi:hypothetical protein
MLDSFFGCKTVFENGMNFLTGSFQIYFECNLDKIGTVRHKEIMEHGFGFHEVGRIEAIFPAIKKDIDNYRNKLWC